MNVYIYPTDRDWYSFLSLRRDLDEVNFWRPGGKQRFGLLTPGDLLLFRLGKPDNVIAGGGVYTHFSFAPLFQAWEAFGEKNGTASYNSFLDLVARYRKFEGPPDQVSSAIIGCIVLTAPFFLTRERWIPVPREYEVNSPQGQRFDAALGVGRQLLEAVQDAVRLEHVTRVSEGIGEPVRFGESVVRRRLGQGGFSLIVSDAYEKRCAVTGERTMPVLEAAHIIPVDQGGMHRPDNGLLLRSDIHKLFDRGYVTIQPNGAFRVSHKLREDWQNGRVYYDFDGRDIRLPTLSPLRPGREFLQWHNDTVFKG